MPDANRNAYMRVRRAEGRAKYRAAKLASYGLTDAERRGASDKWMLGVLSRAKREGRLTPDGRITANPLIRVGMPMEQVAGIWAGIGMDESSLRKHRRRQYVGRATVLRPQNWRNL